MEIERLKLKGDVVMGNFEGALSEGAADGDPVEGSGCRTYDLQFDG